MKCPEGRDGKPLLPEQIWKDLHPAAKAVICALAAENEVLRNEIFQLKKRVEELEEKLRTNSANSSNPPSSDPPGTEPKRKDKRRGSKRKRGGQPGHEGRSRQLLPPKEVNTFVACPPPACCDECGGQVEQDGGEPDRHQRLELPEIKPHVTEYDRYHGTCSRCGKHFRGSLPEGIGEEMLGPRASAVVAILSGKYHASKREIEEIMADFFGMEICLGTVCNTERRVSEALAPAVEEAKESAKDEERAHLDETGWKEGAKRAWLWAMVTVSATIFLVRQSRGAQVARELLGEGFLGIVISDRWTAYNWIKTTLRQLCWAHLTRDFVKIWERGGASETVGATLLYFRDRMFEIWYRVRDGTMSRKSFRRKMKKIREGLEEALAEGTCCGHSKTEETCKNILKLKDALWTFVDVVGVEPTNNDAERVVRSGVLWRKRSFGTDSPTGSLFVERILTVCATCKQHGRGVLEFVTGSVEASLAASPPPSLLPGKEKVAAQAAA
jgi:transposase